MSAQASATEAAVSFQIAGNDVGPLFVDRLRAAWNGSSPLAAELERYRANSRSGSEGLAQVLAHPGFSDVATILARPDFRMLHRTGGGSLPVSIFGAYRNRSVGEESLVVVSPSFEGSYLLQYFPTADDYLDWWVDTIASKVEETSPNYLPPPLSLEALAYLLHAVDCYRRATFQGMLSYAPTDALFVTAAEFAETMPRSMASMDLRWLLPAFLFLTPGLNGFPFDPGPEDMEPLVEHDFLIPAQQKETGEDIFLFGEAGKALGVEFYRSWMLAVGFDTAQISADGERVLHRAFLAPTALANHFLSLEVDGAGKGVVNHQTMTAAELRWKLEEMLVADLSAGEIAGEVARSLPEDKATAASSGGNGKQAAGDVAGRCPHCGVNVNAAARFCGACGKPISNQ